MPGYEAAWKSAVDAGVALIEKSHFLIQHESTPLHLRPLVVSMARLNSGLGDPKKIVSEIVDRSPPDDLSENLRRAAEAMKNAERTKKQTVFSDISGYQAVKHLTNGQPELAALSATLIMGKQNSPLRASLPALWIQCAFWLIEAPEAAAYLETRRKMIPELDKQFREINADTVRKWISDFGLQRGALDKEHAGEVLRLLHTTQATI